MTSQALVHVKVQFESDRMVSINGPPRALRELADLVRSTDARSIILRPDLAEPDEAIAASLNIEPGEGKVYIHRRGNALVISGSAAARETLASNIGSLADRPGQPGDHIHIEFFPDHYYLAEGSLPVVVELSQ